VARPILVGYDPRTGDSAPVRFGAALARLIGAPLIVGSVNVAESGEAVDHLRRELLAAGVAADFRALPGASTPAALHHAAESSGAGLLVTGSTRRGRVTQESGGSTAERLLRGTPCPVAVVSFDWEEGAGLKTIGVAFEDTAEEQAALPDANALAARTGAQLRVLHVGADASIEDAAGALIDGSRSVDLLVCGSHSRELRRAVILGGVARRVIAAAHCPVIVLARGAEPGLQALLGQREDATA
jgi:nucleotide-binding universal stress UspA family protein